jgi:hypothetical protein
MNVQRASAEQIRRLTVSSLGVADDADLFCDEVLSELVRRAVAVRAPIAPRQLLDVLCDSLVTLPGFNREVAARIEELCELMVTSGDLFEAFVDSDSGSRRRMFYGSAPGFVRRRSGAGFLIGIPADGILPSEVSRAVRRQGHIRVLPHESIATVTDSGFRELDSDAWVDAPQASDPQRLIDQYLARLADADHSVSADDLQVISQSGNVRFYSGRWKGTAGASGIHVGRRGRSYGADLWCCVDLAQGQPVGWIDLPLSTSRYRGCDEAWHLLAAIDAVRGEPQVVEVNRRQEATQMRFFSPIPSWAQHRIELIGEPVVGARGCLFAIDLKPDDEEDEFAFLASRLWLRREES